MALLGAGLLFAVAMISVVGTQDAAQDPQVQQRRRERFTATGVVDPEGPAGGGPRAKEAPSGFDNQTCARHGIVITCSTPS